MAMAAARLKTSNEAPRPRAQDIDRIVGARMRERRMMLGLTQQQMAELIGVTYQQAHKYEKGINRISAGRLRSIAKALGVEVGFFFESAEAGQSGSKPSTQQRLLLELARSFIALPSRKHQEAICNLARVLSHSDPLGEPDLSIAVDNQASTDTRSGATRGDEPLIVGP
jgi:transcriptional regulator with XRE-family HTH domain